MEHQPIERTTREVREHLADVIGDAIAGKVTFITSNRRRVAAVVPLTFAETIDRDWEGKGGAVMSKQYGIRWPTGSVFAFASREAAEAALREDGRGVGVLAVHDVQPGTPNCTEWREVVTP